MRPTNGARVAGSRAAVTTRDAARTGTVEDPTTRVEREWTAAPSRAAGDGGDGGTGIRPRVRLTPGQWTKLTVFAIVLTVLGGAAGWAMSLVLPPTYAADAQILYSISQEQPTGFLREDRNITTQTVMMQSRSVLEPVASKFGISVQDLAKRVQATVVEGSEVITIRVTDQNQQRALNLMTELVKHYLDVSDNNPRTELRDYINNQLTDLETRIAEVRPEAETRQGELAALVSREQALQTQLDDLKFSDIVGPGATVLVQPYLEAVPVSPKPLITTLAGAVSALVVAVLAAAYLARRMTRRRR